MAKGKPIINMFKIETGETITAFCRVREFTPDKYIVMATKQGVIKKVSLDAFSNPRTAGVNAMNLPKGDELIEAQISDGSHEIVLATRQGMAIRFPEEKVRPMGRTAYGVRGVKLEKGDYVIGMVVVKRDSSLLVVTENGYGKRTAIEDYRVTNRGGKGVINVKTSDRNGEVVSIKEVLDNDELILITKKGIANRQPVKDIKVIGRNTQGVRLISLKPGDLVTDVARVVKEEEDSGTPD
jgi:DNA gyrase subunit A